MQLIANGFSVPGSRHGIIIDPANKRCNIIRFDEFTSAPVLNLKAGVIIAGKEYTLPLCADGGNFFFYDQRLTPCTMSVMGIDPASTVKLELSIAVPFRPRDNAFSTTPVMGLRLSASKLKGQFRWMKNDVKVDDVEVFIEFAGDAITVEESGADSIDMVFDSVKTVVNVPESEGHKERKIERTPVKQRDRIVVTDGVCAGKRFVKKVKLGGAEDTLALSWCTHSAPLLEIKHTPRPFKYIESFKDLDAVTTWARKNPSALFDNAANVDGIVMNNNCAKSVNNLFAQTLHAWLLDSWWVVEDGRDWFTVWEGSCYYHSTVDVEFTQAPFYLAVWPELLGIELENWPDFSKDGTKCLGERGKGTLFLSHDMGRNGAVNGQIYHHEMEVEETTNYIILLYAYMKRTGDKAIVKRKKDILKKYLAFIEACDTTGNGIPDKGVANTIDDASPAVQFGKEQIYLAVKTVASYRTGAEMLTMLGETKLALRYKKIAAKITVIIEKKGWRKDHFVTLLDKSAEGVVNAWTGEKYDLAEIPGWDAAHIYTVNGQAPLDMVGHDLGLDDVKIKKDLVVAAKRCLREYGCVHSDFLNSMMTDVKAMEGLAGASRNPGWISMNMLRDIAAFYRGVDLRYLADRYWDWQTTTNSQEARSFFETFNGNNLCFYPRGVAVWGYFDALAGLVIDKVKKIDRAKKPFAGVSVPRMFDADWKKGKAKQMVS
ncbi:MAG: DUF4965 domain-containing protein [Spirochaetes bacterium]|nr:DUF4965 domain-containing protein [Spirochaetota bacterium]